MHKKFILSVFFSLFAIAVFSQDSDNVIDTKTARHYVGVQINQLIRQILNFSGSSSVINNPYLLNYAVNFGDNQWGVNFGVGYTFNEFNDGDAFTQRSTKINEFFTRGGFEKKSQFGKRWILSAGVDVVAESKNNSTTTNQGGGGGGVGEFKTENDSKGFGLGPRVTLNYEISDKLLIGTEATYYFKSTTSNITNSGAGADDEIEEKFKNFQFGAPAVIFLILKF